METEILIALIGRMVDERLALQPPISGPRGPRGLPGHAGNNGKDFVFSEHEGVIREWAREFALKFEDLSEDQIDSLRGPRGRDGRDGSDGRSFIFEENRNAIESTIRGVVSDLRDSLRLRFEDLSADEISALRGPRGKDGRDFNYEEHESRISSAIRGTVLREKDELRLKLSDLTEDEISQLRGPRGRDGNDGRGFNFDDHSDFFEGLRLKFSDLSSDEKDALKIHFSDLTEDEKNSLKLKFSDLTDGERALLRGPRGLRGQRGAQGRDGDTGLQGPRGLPGPRGISGIPGRNGISGLDGRDGKSAPIIIAIELEQVLDEVFFVFTFSDGNSIRTDGVKLPEPNNYYSVAGGSAGGRGKMNYDTRIDEASTTVMYVGKTNPGFLTSNDAWQIQRITTSGTETIVEFADSNDKFDNIWDNRASLAYG